MANRRGLTIALSVVAAYLPFASVLVAQVPPPRSAQPNQSGQARPSAAIVPIQAVPLPSPFQLAPQEQAEIDKLLVDWQRQSDSVKYFTASFVRYRYDPAFTNGNARQPTVKSIGEVKYAAPDKAMFKVNEMWNYTL